jgi:hypothetical protein
MYRLALWSSPWIAPHVAASSSALVDGVRFTAPLSQKAPRRGTERSALQLRSQLFGGSKGGDGTDYLRKSAPALVGIPSSQAGGAAGACEMVSKREGGYSALSVLLHTVMHPGAEMARTGADRPSASERLACLARPRQHVTPGREQMEAPLASHLDLILYSREQINAETIVLSLRLPLPCSSLACSLPLLSRFLLSAMGTTSFPPSLTLFFSGRPSFLNLHRPSRHTKSGPPSLSASLTSHRRPPFIILASALARRCRPWVGLSPREKHLPGV